MNVQPYSRTAVTHDVIMIVLPMIVLLRITSRLNGTYRRHNGHKIRQMHVSGVTANDDDERPQLNQYYIKCMSLFTKGGLCSFIIT